MKNITLSGNTHPGMNRKENEDRFTGHTLWQADKALLVVIDGVGGYAGGDKAAAIALESIDQYMKTPKGDTLTMLREAVIFANNRIAEERKKDLRYGEMCCVLTAAVADAAAGVVHFVHVGDTRLYRFRKGQMQKLTKDHSFVGIREDAGEISEREAMNHPQRNQILREVGSALHRMDDEDFMDYGREEFLPGDLLLMCSDGLTDMVTVQQISRLLAASASLDNKVNNLIALANEMGGHDNITVVLIRNSRAKTKTTTPKGKKGTVENIPPVPAPVETPTPPKKSSFINTRMRWNIFLIIFLGVISWYFITQKSAASTASVTDNKKDSTHWKLPIQSDTLQKKASTLFSGDHAAPAGPSALRVMDTVRISATQNLADIQRYADSTGRMLLLLPAREKSNHFAALQINRRRAAGDTLLIRNLHVKGFETGIKVNVPVFISMQNMVFENVKIPVSYQYKTDSTSNYSTALIINTGKQ